MRFVYILSALFLAGGVALAGWFVGDALIESRKPVRTVTVKGLAETDVKADLGFWPIRFTATGPDLATARTGLSVSEQAVRAYLGAKGFDAEAVSVQNIQVQDRLAGYSPSDAPSDARFVLTEDLLVTTKNVDALADAARGIADLIKAGVVFSADAYSAGPSFVFTGLNQLKGDMLTKATERAREAAQKFAVESGSSVGGIKTANQGVFQIMPAVTIPNDRPDKQMEKKVRVVTTITYFLTN